MTTPPPPGQPPQPFPHNGPPAGHSGPGHPPPPTPTARRIPEDQPFVVRPSVAKQARFFGATALVVGVPVSLITGLIAANRVTPESRSTAWLVVATLLGFALLFSSMLLGLKLWRTTSRGPVLALSPAGLWIRSRPTGGHAVWLPWEAVAQIYRTRWTLEKALVFQLRDQRTLQQLNSLTVADIGLLRTFHSTGPAVTLNTADKPEAEILAAVAHYSAGRCPVI